MMRALFRFRPRLPRIAADQRGTSVIELALVAPILSLLTMGIVDISNGYSRRMELIQAANRTAELVAANHFKIPEKADGSPDFSELVADAAAAAGVAEDQVDVYRWLECDGVEQTDYHGLCEPQDPDACEGDDPPADCSPVIARYVEIRIDDSFRPMFGIFFARNADGSFLFERVRAESWGGGDEEDDDWESGGLDPSSLLKVVDALARLTRGLPIDPASGAILS